MAPRKTDCLICQKISAIEDVNVRIFGEGGVVRKRYSPEVLSYLRSCGLTVHVNTVRRHKRHVEDYLRNSSRAVLPDKLTRLSPGDAPPQWFDLQDQAMEVATEALRDLNARVAAGDLAARDLIEIANLGVKAASSRAAVEAKGKAHDLTLMALAAIASGHVERD